MGAQTLLEEHNVLGVQSEESVLLEKGLRLRPSGPAGHDIPRDDDGTGLLRFLCSDCLEPLDALGLVLEERLVRGKADVVATFGRRAAEPGTLPAGHEEDTDLSTRDGLQTDAPPLLLLVRVLDDRLGCVLWQRLDDLCPGLLSLLLLRAYGFLEDTIDAFDVERLELRLQLLALGVGELWPEGEEVALAGGLVALAEGLDGHFVCEKGKGKGGTLTWLLLLQHSDQCIKYSRPRELPSATELPRRRLVYAPDVTAGRAERVLHLRLLDASQPTPHTRRPASLGALTADLFS